MPLSSSPVTFLQPGPTWWFSHFLTVCEDTAFISGLNHWLDQSPQDLVLSGNALTDTPRANFTIAQALLYVLKLTTGTSTLSRLPSFGGVDFWDPPQSAVVSGGSGYHPS